MPDGVRTRVFAPALVAGIDATRRHQRHAEALNAVRPMAVTARRWSALVARLVRRRAALRHCHTNTGLVCHQRLSVGAEPSASGANALVRTPTRRLVRTLWCERRRGVWCERAGANADALGVAGHRRRQASMPPAPR